ncbi:MAG: 23S rRNA (guanosine(2251)-2'-O)-methyltransferase RlmB [Firmicutes bacterium]|jgi:23S rRNA (guanosine2251-2'-O)-methyltransferase|nr:23S rRNA (guanosine(2251)-2'-O)-methyltransferase RlmB [Bacillota bacterium]
MSGEREQIEGKNPVREALRAGVKLDRLVLAKGSERSLQEIVELASAAGIPVEWKDREWLDKRSRTRAHQGVMGWREPVEYAELPDLLENAWESARTPLLVILDGIQDPHNLGSVLRTAEAVGAHGIVIPKRRAVGLTATVAKVSAGALEYVPVARVTNLSQAIEAVKEAGLWVVGADMDGEMLHFEADLTGPLALVVGSEGKGLARLTKEKCDLTVRLPMYGKINSLNAAVAAAVMLYEVVRQRARREKT